MQLPPLPPLHDSGGQCSRPLPPSPRGHTASAETNRGAGEAWVQEGKEVRLSVSCRHCPAGDDQYLSSVASEFFAYIRFKVKDPAVTSNKTACRDIYSDCKRPCHRGNV
ncbi:hypothetical protein E2C01_083658 [Portunus trituberculatus]|uniref:Uncharacterized protein n=1 Tax=Portunus trituberculatus TaxID=210409 RepID=A0A5B7J2A9_PORTR|nr:hypothetical protein [Portunus trituberculatus]